MNCRTQPLIQTHRVKECGYNSPFEEFSIAFELTRRGIATIYPRAIYKTGLTADTGCIADKRRYESHAGILTPEGTTRTADGP